MSLVQTCLPLNVLSLLTALSLDQAIAVQTGHLSMRHLPTLLTNSAQLKPKLDLMFKSLDMVLIPIASQVHTPALRIATALHLGASVVVHTLALMGVHNKTALLIFLNHQALQ
jgi:hypothetical protein